MLTLPSSRVKGRFHKYFRNFWAPYSVEMSYREQWDCSAGKDSYHISPNPIPRSHCWSREPISKSYHFTFTCVPWHTPNIPTLYMYDKSHKMLRRMASFLPDRHLRSVVSTLTVVFLGGKMFTTVGSPSNLFITINLGSQVNHFFSKLLDGCSCASWNDWR